MIKKWVSLVLATLMVLGTFSFSFADAEEGSLLIVGGMLRNDNKAVYEKLIALGGGAEKIKIAIIGAATSKSVRNSKRFRDDLSAYGVAKTTDADLYAGVGHFYLVPIAVSDDSTTKDFNESTWATNGNSADVAAKVAECNAVWFVGGDQTLITETLLNKDGSDTLVLKAIRGIYDKGGLLAGSSAGAAIMSKVMLAGGSSFGAMLQGSTTVYEDMSDQEAGPVYTTSGLDFFKGGIVDQHFDRKARLGRLVVALYDNKSLYRYGFGVDENTAMAVTKKGTVIEPIGTGGVTIVDIKDAVKDTHYANGGYDKVRFSYIETHDQFNLTTGEFTIDADKDLQTIGDEYYSEKFDQNTGIFSPNPLMRQYLGHGLVDNSSVTALTSYAFDESGNGVKITFSEDALTKGYYQNYGDTYAAREDRYIATNVLLKTQPITVTIAPAPIKSVVSTYTIKAGDMLWKVAKAFQTTVAELMKLNDLKNPNMLTPGQLIKVPSK
jgi:cyanophycinase